ncbi:TPA: hypothetical protein ACN3MR_002871 [Stenotrophomonas maltophilia]
MATDSVNPKLDTQAVAQAVSDALDKPPRIELAVDRHWTDYVWDDSNLDPRLTDHLRKVDRCIGAASSLAALMHRHAIAAQDVQSSMDDEVARSVYPAIKPNDLDRLWVGLNELIDAAEFGMDRVRNFQEVRRG